MPDVYVSDAMENALSPTVLSSWNISTLRSTVWGEKRQRRKPSRQQGKKSSKIHYSVAWSSTGNMNVVC